ncbi:MAG: NUDIX hydrolase [Bacteroidota bacterium]
MTKHLSLTTLIHHYQTEFEEEVNFIDRFKALLQEDYCFERKNLKAHFTGSCWVTNSQLDKVLLLHHAKLDRWLQPGGHADGDQNLLSVAMKELSEETGISTFENNPDSLFDIDIHTIPERKNVPEHEHFDARFHFIVDEGLNLEINSESNALKWISINDVIEMTNYEKSFERMVRKTKELVL